MGLAWHERIAMVLKANENADERLRHAAQRTCLPHRSVPYSVADAHLGARQALGDHQLGQAIVCSTMRPVLQTLGIEHFAIERLEDVEFVADGMIRQAYSTQAPAAVILSPLLTRKGA